MRRASFTCSEHERPILRGAPRGGPHGARRRGALPAAGIVLAGLLLACGAAHAEDLTTRAEAIEIVFDVIVPASIDHNVTAFLGMNMLDAGDVIGPWDEPEKQRTIDGPTWFCWVDDDPGAFFAHNTRYVFIDAVTGEAEVIVEEWWPELNGESLFMTDAEWEDPELVIHSSIHTTTVGGAP